MKLKIVAGLFAGACVAVAGPAAAATDIAKLAAIYGARDAAWGVRLSPSGEKIMLLTPAGPQGAAVVVVDLQNATRKIILSSDKATVKPNNCNWKTEDRIICQLHILHETEAQDLSYNRAMSIAADGSSRIDLGQRSSDDAVQLDQAGARVIDWLPDDPKHVLMSVNIAEKTQVGSIISSGGGGLSVQLVNVENGQMSPVERANHLVNWYGADNAGNVRARAMQESGATGYLRDKYSIFVRSKGSKEWRSIYRDVSSGNSDFEYLGFDESGDNLLTARTLDGRYAVYREPVDGTGERQMLFAHPKVDVDEVLRIGKYNRPVAAAYVTDSTQYAYFDKTLEKRVKALSSALPGMPTVEILDESWDGSKDLVFVSGASTAGEYYRFDVTQRQFAPLLSVRPDLANLAYAPQSGIHYKAADGSEIPAYLTIPPGPKQGKRPAIIMPHGGPAARDSLGFDWLSQYFAQLGYVVLQPNYRGSTGYGGDWYVDNGFKSWKTAIGDINDGARWLVAEGIADPAKLVIFGWSYGGYAALQANVLDPSLYKAAVAVAPVTDLAQLKADSKNFTNYTIVANYIGEGPHIAAGSPAQNAARIMAPVLMFHGDRDQNVDIGESKLMDSALTKAGKTHEYVVYRGLAHSLDDSDVRADMLKRSAEFMAAALTK